MGSGESAAFLAAAPEPTAGKRGQRLQAPARRSTSAPPNPKNPLSQLAVQFEFRFSQASPKQKAQQGLGTASCEWVFGGFGVTGKVRAKDLPLEGSNSAGELLLKESQSLQTRPALFEGRPSKVQIRFSPIPF